MNEIFNFRRFGLMLAVDSNRIVRRYGLSFLLISFSELIVFAVASIVMLAVDGTMACLDNNIRSLIFVMSAFVLTLTMPQKCYGGITDKSKGSAYLAIPASSLEKFISMILLMILVMPALFTSVSWCVDSTLSHLFPKQFTDVITDSTVTLGYPWSDITKILAFGMPWWLLGALWFRKGKGAKTLLCLLIFSSIAVLFGPFSHVGIEIENGVIVEESRSYAGEILTVVINASLLFLIYLRIRKIQH